MKNATNSKRKSVKRHLLKNSPVGEIGGVIFVTNQFRFEI